MEENKYHMLVNKENKCEDISDFEIMDVGSVYNPLCKLEKITLLNWLKFKKQALIDGFDIEVESAYRSIEYQEKVYKEIAEDKGEEYARTHVAIPGYSEHHTGLALDVCIKIGDEYKIDYDLIETGVVKYMEENAHKFGFIIRYPKDKENITGYNYEPWHLRYVGYELASELHNNDFTLEEYYSLKKLK